MPGYLCISLDFEKFWGVRDVTSYSKISHNFLKIEQIVYRLLAEFEAGEIHCSWAFVGFLAARNKEELIEWTVGKRITYSNVRFSPYPVSREILKSQDPKTLFGRNELVAIHATPGQELGSHTFSHYYCLEVGQTANDFLLDTSAMKKVCHGLGVQVKSIVFPRNQVSREYLQICRDAGITAFRGNQESEFWENTRFEDESLWRRQGRWRSAYYNSGQKRWRKIEQLDKVEGMLNIPANRFLRPPSALGFLERKKIALIKSEMSHAAKNGFVYHLWWHPHNFSCHTKTSFQQLNEIISHFAILRDQYGFESKNMGEIANYA